MERQKETEADLEIYIYIYTERERVMRQSCLSPVDDGGFRRVEDGTGNSKRHAA